MPTTTPKPERTPIPFDDALRRISTQRTRRVTGSGGYRPGFLINAGGTRELVRIAGLRATIGDRVQELAASAGYPIFEVIQ